MSEDCGLRSPTSHLCICSAQQVKAHQTTGEMRLRCGCAQVAQGLRQSWGHGREEPHAHHASCGTEEPHQPWPAHWATSGAVQTTQCCFGSFHARPRGLHSERPWQLSGARTMLRRGFVSLPDPTQGLATPKTHRSIPHPRCLLCTRPPHCQPPALQAVAPPPWEPRLCLQETEPFKRL